MSLPIDVLSANEKKPRPITDTRPTIRPAPCLMRPENTRAYYIIDIVIVLAFWNGLVIQQNNDYNESNNDQIGALVRAIR